MGRHSRRLRFVWLACGVMLAVAARLGPYVSAQSATASIRVQASAEIAGVITGGTQAQVSATGLNGADDLMIDNDGRVYAITAAGIEVLTEAGQPLGIIPVTCTPAGVRCQALAFGGPDKRTLYIAGNGTLLKIQMIARGFTGRAK